jgi:integrase
MKAEFNVVYFLWMERKDKKGLIPVYVRSRQNSARPLLYNTGVKILPSRWNKKKNEPKNKPAALLELEGKLKATYLDLFNQGEVPTLQDLIKHKEDKRKPTSGTVVSWCDDYLQSPKYSAGMKKAVATLKTNIEGWSKSITFERLKGPQIERFFDHLAENKVANNSQYKRYRALVNVARHANVTNPDLLNYKISGSTVNALKVRLNWQEVKAIMNAETETKLEGIAKDVFMLACFSGLRISDILTLNRGELHDYHYERIQIKSKKPVLVTIHKYNEILFKRYINTGVPYSRQKLSDALKDVLKRVPGMDKEVVHIQHVGHHVKENTFAKYEQIAFHSGRRFYARLLSDLGLGEEITRDEMGHSADIPMMKTPSIRIK